MELLPATLHVNSSLGVFFTSNPGKRFQRDFAGDGVTDNGTGVSAVEFHPSASQNFGGRLPRLVQPGIRKPFQFRTPAADIISKGVILLALADGIEYA